MKKLFTSLLLLVGVITAQAYDLYVGGVQVTTSNQDNITGSTISGSVKFDGNKTLTLTNATIKNTSSNGISNNGINDLTIKIAGNCTIEGLNGIRATVKTTIWGADFTAYATIKGTSSYGVYANGDDVIFDFRDGWYSVTGAKYALYTDKSNVTLDFSWSDVYLKSENSSNSCIFGFNNIRRWATTYDYNGNKYSNKQLVNSSGNVVSSATVKGMLCVGKYIISTNGSNVITLNKDSKGAGITSGTVKYNQSTKELTFDGTTINTGSNCIVRNYAVDGLDIYFLGTCNLTNTGNNSIYSVENFTMEANSRTQATVTLTNAGASDAICLGQYKSDRTMTFETIGITVNSKGSCLHGNGDGTLKINESKLTLNSSSEYAAESIKACEMTKDAVNTAESPVYFNTSKKGFTNISASLVQKAVIDVPTSSYSVYVLGNQLNNLNASNVIVEGLSAGKIAYDSSNKTLTLTGAQLTAPAGNDNNALDLGVAGMTVKLVDNGSTENNITSGKGYALRLSANATITGSGRVTFTSTESSGCAMSNSSTTLTLDATGRISFIGANYGMAAFNLVMKKSSGGFHYRFKGGSNASLYINSSGGNFTYNGLDLWSGYSMDANTTYGCYYDNGYVREPGGAVAKGLVAFRYIEEKYGFSVGGTPVNDCNAAGIGSKYITAGGGKAAVYDKDSKTLTLTGATIDNNGEDINPIRNEDVEDFIVKVASNSTLKSTRSGWGGFYTKKNTTFTGSGKLTVDCGNSDYGVSVSGGSLTLKDINMEIKGALKGYTSGSDNYLYVDLSSGKQVEVSGNVKDFTDFIPRNGSKIVAPGNAYYDNNKRFVTVDGSTAATGIVFADKNTAAIDAIELANDAEVKTIFDAAGRETTTAKRGLNIIRMSDGTVRKVMVK